MSDRRISQRLRRWTIAIGLFGLGVVFGPVLLAAASGLAASSAEPEHWSSAYSLMKAYDERYPQLHMSTLDLTGDIIDCGYEPESLFGADFGLRDNWTPYVGYFELTLWRNGEFRRQVETARADYLRGQFSPFAATFLDQCLRRTLFAPVCGSLVRDRLESGNFQSRHSLPPNSPRPNESRQNRTICTYLDGVAARRGQPISRRQEEQR